MQTEHQKADVDPQSRSTLLPRSRQLGTPEATAKSPPERLSFASAGHLLALQRTAGNMAVAKTLHTRGITVSRQTVPGSSSHTPASSQPDAAAAASGAAAPPSAVDSQPSGAAAPPSAVDSQPSGAAAPPSAVDPQTRAILDTAGRRINGGQGSLYENRH